MLRGTAMHRGARGPDWLLFIPFVLPGRRTRMLTRDRVEPSHRRR